MLALVVAAAMAFAVFEPIQVLPRIRLAPGYALDDQNGEPFTSESVRGSVTLYTFAPTSCDPEATTSCDEIAATMAEISQRMATEVDLGAVDVQLVTVALDADPSPSELAAAAARAGADGDRWRWVGGEAGELRTVVGAGFRQFFEPAAGGSVRFDPGYVLVDGSGVIRGEYRYQTLARDADKIVHHIDILAAEIRHASGAAAVAYEAAHLFLCYP